MLVKLAKPVAKRAWVTNWEAVNPPVVRLLEICKLPANELEVVLELWKVPARSKLLVMPTLPAKELEALVVKVATVPTRPLLKAKLPAKELEPVKDELSVLASARDLDKFREPAKLLEPVEEPIKPPAVVKDLVTVREPAKEEEPVVPAEITKPLVVRLPVAWRPRPRLRLPAKELEAVDSF